MWAGWEGGRTGTNVPWSWNICSRTAQHATRRYVIRLLRVLYLGLCLCIILTGVSFDFNVSYSSCWGYSLINTLKLTYHHSLLARLCSACCLSSPVKNGRGEKERHDKEARERLRQRGNSTSVKRKIKASIETHLSRCVCGPAQTVIHTAGIGSAKTVLHTIGVYVCLHVDDVHTCYTCKTQTRTCSTCTHT